MQNHFTYYPVFCQPPLCRIILHIQFSVNHLSAESFYISRFLSTSSMQNHFTYPVFCQPHLCRIILHIQFSVNLLYAESFYISSFLPTSSLKNRFTCSVFCQPVHCRIIFVLDLATHRLCFVFDPRVPCCAKRGEQESLNPANCDSVMSACLSPPVNCDSVMSA